MKISITISLLFLSIFLLAQGEIDDQDKIFFRNERTYGLLLNSNGFGFNYRYGKRTDAFRKTLYELEFNYLKHPKEVKITLPGSNRNISYGKINATYTLKGALGFQNEMFQKRDKGGVSIRYFINFGPSLAFLKPVYYEYYSNNYDSTYYKKFEPHQTIERYVGKAPFSKGFNELKLQPGIYVKFGFTFEYSKVDEIFHALELGAAFDAYAGKVPIMYAEKPGKLLFVLPDDQFYYTLFISYRFGQVINTQYRQKRNKVDKLIAN